MQPFSVRAAEVARASQIAVLCLVSRDNDDIEFWPVRPRWTPQSERTSPEEFARRQLRTVAVLGLNGLTPLSAFQEALEPHVVEGLYQAFLAYVQCSLGEHFAEHMAVAEVQEMQRMYALPDTRIN
jgi:hypothetical protein